MQNENTSKLASGTLNPSLPDSLLHMNGMMGNYYKSKLEPNTGCEMANGCKGSQRIKFTNNATDHRARKVYTEMSVRRVGNKNPKADIQIDITRRTQHDKTSRTECTSFSIPADFAEFFIRLVSEYQV